MLVNTFTRKCNKCKLSCGASVGGYGVPNPKLIVISDYPGREEMKTNIPFSGVTGKVIRYALKNMVGIDPDTEVYMTNVIKCPPGDGVGPKELHACSHWLSQEMQYLPMHIPILIAGGLAKQVMLPHIEEGLGEVHGTVVQHHGRTYFLSWNPAYVDKYTFSLDGGLTKARPVGSVSWMYERDMKRLREWLLGLGVELNAIEG